MYYLDVLQKRTYLPLQQKYYLAGNAFSQVIQVIEMETTKRIMDLKNCKRIR